MLGHREAERVPELLERRDRILGDRNHLVGAHGGIGGQSLVRALHERTRGEPSFLQARCRLQARGHDRVGFRQASGFVEEMAELGLDACPLARIFDAQLERGREPRRRLPVCHRGHGGLGRTQVVVDRALGARERSGKGEVVRELGEHAARDPRREPVRRASPTRRCSSGRRRRGIRSYTARRTSSCVKRAAGSGSGSSSSRPLRVACSKAVDSAVPVELGGRADDAELEPRPGDGCELDHRPGLGCEP